MLIKDATSPLFGEYPLRNVIEWLNQGDRITLKQGEKRRIIHKCPPTSSSAKSSFRKILVILSPEVMMEFWTYVLCEARYQNCTCQLNGRVHKKNPHFRLEYSLPPEIPIEQLLRDLQIT